MKRLHPLFALFLACSPAAWAAAPGILTTLSAVHALSNSEASHALPVAFQATATFYLDAYRALFVQDGDEAIFVLAPESARIEPGDRVLVRGVTHASFRPFITNSSVTVLHHGELPKPVPANFDQLIRGERDCQFANVIGTVRAANLGVSPRTGERYVNLQLLLDGGVIDATVNNGDAVALNDLVDAQVEVTGAVSGKWDGKMQLTGIWLHVPAPSGLKILKRPGSSQWTLPLTPMDMVLSAYHVRSLTQKVRVHGTITYYLPGSAVVLQSGNMSIWIMTLSEGTLRIGDAADATGFPDVRDGTLTLTDGEIQDSHVPAPVVPVPATWSELALIGSAQRNHVFDLVSIQGKMVMEAREGTQDEYVLETDGKLFSAIYYHPIDADQALLPPLREVPPGSRVALTGICATEQLDLFGRTAADTQTPFSILLRTPSDIAVVARPSLLTVRNLALVTSGLLLVIFASGAWGWTLTRKVRRQSEAMAIRIEAEAAVERQRSRILENINGAGSLAVILVAITELVSSQLAGAPCWCEVADGARLGNCPPEAASLRVVQTDIPAPSGPSLGTISAGFPLDLPPRTSEVAALSMGSKLAVLAIGTRHLYDDLRHRSHFDLLTEVHNRFSLEKQLDECIDEARHGTSVFALIYVDLDEFKQINDLYGHQVGDQYLQHAAQRMKRELRSVDMFARLGGDEFAAVVSVAHNRTEVEEIAQRMGRSFDEPFALGGHVFHGEASIGIALYPTDGATRDTLLSAADAAMYAAKRMKKQVRQNLANSPEPQAAA
jgi:diguanylate cyclase (GGDEF)-like protein